MAYRLEVPFAIQEVFATVYDFNEAEGPSPDGFSISFWLFSWDFVREEVMGFFKELWVSFLFFG